MSEEEAPAAPNPPSEGDAAPSAEESQAQDSVIENPSLDEEDDGNNDPAEMVEHLNLMDQVEDEEEEEDEENPMSTLPPYVVHRVEKLKELNSKRDEIMEHYLKDRAALEAKYHGLCEPLYTARANIVKGDFDDKIAEAVQAAESASKDEGKNDEAKEEESQEAETENVVGIPQFWVCAMSHMEPLAELITEEDVDCLEKLQNIICIDDAEGTGFTLEFLFAPNDYFQNSVLTKRYEVPNLLLDDEPILKNVEGCKIQWKPGRSLTYREVTKKQRGTGKNAGIVRTVKKKERAESFFHFFEPPKMPSMDDMDEDEADRLEGAFEEDYDVAQAFRSHIIPKAVMWFTGQVRSSANINRSNLI
jgi:nucleosome assembly protein 1-like 1